MVCGGYVYIRGVTGVIWVGLAGIEIHGWGGRSVEQCSSVLHRLDSGAKMLAQIQIFAKIENCAQIIWK